MVSIQTVSFQKVWRPSVNAGVDPGSLRKPSPFTATRQKAFTVG